MDSGSGVYFLKMEGAIRLVYSEGSLGPLRRIDGRWRVAATLGGGGWATTVIK